MHLHTPRRGIRPIEEGPCSSGKMDETRISKRTKQGKQWQVLRRYFWVYHVVVVAVVVVAVVVAVAVAVAVAVVVVVVPYLYVCEFDNLTKQRVCTPFVMVDKSGNERVIGMNKNQPEQRTFGYHPQAPSCEYGT